MISLGIDVGTTHTKVLALEAATGTVAALATTATPVHQDGDGDVHRPGEILEIVIDLIAVVAGQLDAPEQVRCLSVASVGEEVVLLNAAGAPLGGTPAWYDERSHPGAAAFLAAAGASVPSMERWPPDPSFSLFTLLWLRDQRPQEYASAATWTDLGDFVLHGLGATLAMDWSHASRAGGFDLDRRAWDAETIAAAGLGLRFPPLVPSGSSLGVLDAAIADRLGLSGEVLLVAGGHDHLCAAHGAGVGPDDLFLSAGTSEAHLAITTAPVSHPDGGYHLDQGCFVDASAYYAHINTHAGLIFQEWRERLYPGAADDELYRDLAGVDPDAASPVFVVDDDLHRGHFVEPRPKDVSRASRLTAVLAGLAERSAEIVEFLEAFRGRPFARIVAAGHPPQQPTWRAIREAHYAHPLAVVAEPESTAYGAALLAASAPVS